VSSFSGAGQDAYSKEITGYHLSSRHDTSLVLTALQKAITNYGVPDIIHTDQGSEYRSQEYLQYLEDNQIKASNSAKSSPGEMVFKKAFMVSLNQN